MAVAPDRYRIAFEDGRSPERYVGEFYDNAATLTTATDITVTEETTVTINATLADRTRITGRVTAPNGNPAPNITVNAYISSDFPGMPWAVVADTATDQNGEYSLSNINPGRYRVGFIDMLYPVEFSREYYHDAATIDTATDIIVHQDTVAINIDAQLGRLNVLKGQVMNESGTPLANIQVNFYRYGDLGNQQFGWQAVNGSQTNADGFYSNGGLDPGLYRVAFQDFSDTYHREFYNNVGYIENATTIILTTDMTITDINAQLPTDRKSVV